MDDREAELKAAFPDDVYNTTELQEKFEVQSFCAPYVEVIRKEDRQRGFLAFDHMPRFYYDFSATS